MDDLFNLPFERGLMAVHLYDELNMKCDEKYLRQHTDFVGKILDGAKFGINEFVELKRANEQMKQRLEWIVVPDHAYKLASVVFFDASENPARYEPDYARKKIALWKKNDDIDDFFLRKPLRELLPFFNGFDGSFRNYSDLIQKINAEHMATLTSM